MKGKVVLLIFMLSSAVSSFAQNVGLLDGVYVKENTQTRSPLQYPYLREADVMWSKKIWRIIDLNEKINLPLKWPSSGSIRDRKSLIDVLLTATKEGTLTAYDFMNDEFILPITMKDVEVRGGARVDTQRLMRADPPYDEYDTVIAKDFNYDDVIAYRVKEEWYFDKQRSVMEVRIIGIAPLIYAKDEAGNIREGNSKMALCWFYYPECRKLLASAETFNRQNDAERRTFDDIFQKRLFNSYIYKESNVYDRTIGDYKTGIATLYESEKIKSDIANMEHDMWEY
jgi:gliding motility associated protien GldN